MPTFNKAAKWFRRLLGKGANRDIRPELLPDGLYADGYNIRPNSISGNDGGIEAVEGEMLVYNTSVSDPSGYYCIGSAASNNDITTFWAHPDPANNPPLVITNGVLLARSTNIPYTYNRPLQIAVVEKPVSGVLYPADHQSPPLFWDIAAMQQALADGEQTYFDAYTTDTNQVVLSAYSEFPRHNATIDAGTGSGLPPGQYLYFLRYEAPTGDKTNFGPETPLISIGLVHDFTWNSTAVPGSRTTGGRADVTIPTRWGIQLEFNIDNTLGFEFAEVCRRRFNNGEGLNGPGIAEVIARIPIIPGEFRTVIFNDPADTNVLEIIPEDIVEQRQFDILSPKGVEYADNRVSYANFRTAPRTPEYVFREVDGNAFVPVTNPVTSYQAGVELNSGFTDPVNNTYLKSYTRGEIYGLAVQGWDSKNAKPYAVPIPGAEDWQAPNRRDPMTGDSIIYSIRPPYAASTDNQSSSPVSLTFDAFTQGTYRKSNSSSLVNVIAPPFVTGAFSNYNPWHPSNPDDGSVQGYNINPTSGRITTGATALADNGYIWNPQYNTLGVALYGMDVPSNIKAFTIVRTQPAGRVICQGIGTYRLDRPDTTPPNFPTGKATREVNFYSRDLLNSYVPQNVLDDMQNNPTNYDLQFVSPLGFYSEYYGYSSAQTGGSGEVVARGADQLSYAGIQHDEGQVNVGEPSAGGMGYQPTPGAAPAGNYVGFGAWRSSQPPNNQGPPTAGSTDYSFWNEGTNNGNTVMEMVGFGPGTDGRGEFVRLFVNNYIYSPGTDTTGGSVDFNDAGVKAFAQPWYVINIVRRGAEVPDGTGQYVNTGCTVKMQGCIGISSGASLQSYKLINERWEDVLGWLDTDNRYTWISENGAPTRAWLCITNNANVDGNTVLDAIAADGFYTMPDGTQVYGIYEVVSVDGRYFVNFGSWNGLSIPAPAANARILVRYNKLAPVRAFGGESTIAPSIHAIFDRRYLVNESPYPDGVVPVIGLPLPYKGFQKANNYLLPITSQALQDTSTLTAVESLRQWCVMYDAESRTQSPMDDFGGAYSQGSPRGHYIMQPYDTSTGTAFDGSGYFPQFAIDYVGWGPWYNMGGIRFLTNEQLYNTDYWKQPLITSIGVPEEQDLNRTDYWNGMIASLEADPELESSPGLRTFLPANLKLLSEENGEIKVIASATAPNGQNMYAICESGVCRVLTNKNILTGADGAEVATQSISNYWGTEMWISRVLGSPDQMWRLFAKGYAPAGGGYADSFFWADRNGFYQMMGDTINDISRDRYLSQLKQTLQFFPTDYTPNTTAFYNRRFNEVWFSIDTQTIASNPPFVRQPFEIPKRLFVFSAQNREWVGQFAYAFDSYTQLDSTVYGHRDVQTYALDQPGYDINGEVREASVTTPIVGDMGILKEFTRWAVTGSRPDRIEILDKDYNVICRQDESIAASINPAEAQYWVLRYSKGWEQWAPAINFATGAYNPTDVRPQDELFYLRLTWLTTGTKQAVALSAGYQNLK